MKKLLNLIIAGVIGSLFTLFILFTFYKPEYRVYQQAGPEINGRFASLLSKGADSINNVFSVGFGSAAERSLQQVVHIKSSARMKTGNYQFHNIPDPFRDFFGDDFFRFGPQQRSPEVRQSAGSGVIISSDGYIVTNNHVVDNADEVEVSLHNRKEFKAKVIGTDPSTDLALLKIEGKDLPYASFANSDQVKVGDWVLAVGNPFNLSSTVTAGIVSAKARNINILRDKDNGAIESFIQTDAAVNPGNSGGALVNLTGEVIGINTAIATPTGTYAGYSFAIPSNIVSKVVEDIMKHGTVQRAYLGITIRDLTWQDAKELDLDISEGVLVDSVLAKGSAAQAGIKEKDVITKIDNTPIRTSAELLETIGRHSPGDEVKVVVIRDNKEKEYTLKLKSKSGETTLAKSEKGSGVFESLGAQFEEVSEKECKKLGISSGVRVKSLQAGAIRKYTDMREGFIILKIDNKPIKSVDSVKEAFTGKEGGVLIEGIYPDSPGKYYYGIGVQS
jgi:serine protease Do